MQKIGKFQGSHNKFDWKSRGSSTSVDIPTGRRVNFFSWKTPIWKYLFPYDTTNYPFVLLIDLTDLPFVTDQQVSQQMQRFTT